MKCVGCHVEVSIADARCPKCGHDLLQFGSTKSTPFSRAENSEGHGQKAKDLVFGELHGAVKESSGGLQSDEQRIVASILERRFDGLFLKHISDEAIEDLYEKEIIPFVEGLEHDKLIKRKLELSVIENLGEDKYRYYKRWDDVIKMLFAGELVCMLVKNKDIDLSVKMFEFFKVTEIVVNKHAIKRQDNIYKNPIVVKANNSIADRIENIFDLPHWFYGDSDKKVKSHERPFVSYLDIVAGKPYTSKSKLYNSRNTGFSLFMFGRESITIRGNALPINNIFQANGSMADREQLAQDLCNIQDLRNNKVHENISDNDKDVSMWIRTVYSCLKSIPEVLMI